MRYGTNAYHSLISSVDTVDFYHDLRVAHFTAGGTIIFPLIVCVENVWYTLAPCHIMCYRQEAFCV